MHSHSYSGPSRRVVLFMLCQAVICSCALANGHPGEDHATHKAFLGIPDEDLDVYKMTPKELENHLTKVFILADKNGDKVVDTEELDHWVYFNLIEMDKHEANSRLKEFDKDADDALTFAEFVQGFYGDTEVYLEKMANDMSPQHMAAVEMMREDKQKWPKSDSDGDLKLDMKEFPTFFTSHMSSGMQEVEVKTLIMKRDANKDGVLDLSEFTREGRLDALNKRDKEANEKIFAELDTNKDGRLNRDELKPYALPDLKKIAEHEAEHLLEETDTNNDKVLTKEEVFEQHELWLGRGMAMHHHDPSEL